jgi:antitoxin (DNA-binding transcriptional repressor) of toxin-antitoxin stability system
MRIMKTATVADLRNKFATVSKWIHDGEAVTITKQGIPFATLAPTPRKKAPPPPVDRMARLRRLFPGGPVRGDVQVVIDFDRGQT